MQRFVDLAKGISTTRNSGITVANTVGLWISPELRSEESLSFAEKGILAEIAQFSQTGTCFATNKHFASLLGIGSRQVATYVGRLVKGDWIAVPRKRPYRVLELSAKAQAIAGKALPAGVEAPEAMEMPEEQPAKPKKDRKPRQQPLPDLPPARLPAQEAMDWPLFDETLREPWREYLRMRLRSRGKTVTEDMLRIDIAELEKLASEYDPAKLLELTTTWKWTSIRSDSRARRPRTPVRTYSTGLNLAGVSR